MRIMAHVLLYTYIIVGIFSYMKVPYSDMLYQGKFILFGISFALFLLMSLKFFQTEKQITVNKLIIVLLYTWLIFMFSSMLVNFNGIGSISFSFSLVIALFFTLYLFPNFHTRDIDSILRVFLKLLLFVTLFSIVYSLLGFTPASYVDPSSFRLRYTFGFQNPNYLGMVSFLGIIVSSLLFLAKKKSIYIVYFLLFTYIIVVSDSRTALFSVVLWTVIYISFNLIKKPQFQIVFSLALTALFLIVLQTGSLTFENIDRLLSRRLTYWTSSLESMNSIELFFGKGLGTSASDILANATFDNFFVSIFVQTGIIGFAIFLTLLLMIFIKLIKIKNSRNKRISVSIYLSWIVYSLFESSFISISNPVSIMIWMIIGVLATPKRITQG